MRKTILGKSGLEVSAVGFGGIPIQRLTDDEAQGVLRRALDLGVTFIDTAHGYSDSQKKIGLALEGRDRASVVIASKSPGSTRDDVFEHLEQALSDLGTDYIDLYQHHGISKPERWEAIREKGGALEGMIEARDQGMIRHIGFTSHSADVALLMMEEETYETVQFPFNLVAREPGERLLPVAREKNLGFIVMKPLCGGQYDNARFAFKFLNGYPDMVPIPGIETADEIEEIVPLVESGDTLQGEELEEAQKIVDELGKTFCRRCGYCQPCPQGIPIPQVMIFDGLVKRLPAERVKSGPAKMVAENVPNCVECGQCEKKCPYELEIIKTIHKNLQLAESIIKE